MKDNTTGLNKLISSLNHHEKRYFKLYASRHIKAEKNDYIKLFDLYDKKGGYNEDTGTWITEISSPFRNKSFIRHLRVNEQYLKKLILQSLHLYHATHSVNAQIQQYISYTEILYRKALYGECRKIIRKVKMLAYSLEKFELLTEILRWERQLLLLDQNPEKLSALTEEQLQVQHIIQNQYAYQNILNRFILFLKKHAYIREERRLKEMEALLEDPLLKQKDNALSYKSQKIFFSIWALNFHINSDYPKSCFFYKSLMELIEAHPDDIREGPEDYIAVLHNFMVSCRRLGNSRDFFSALTKLRNIPVASNEIDSRIFTRSYLLEMSWYIMEGSFDKLIALRTVIEEGLTRFKGNIGQEFEINFYGRLFYGYFGLNCFSEARYWLNKILNYGERIYREDYYSFSQILSLIVHFELGNFDLLPYLARTTYRYLYKRKRLYRFESLVLDFLHHRFLKINPQISQEVTDAFRELHNQITEIIKDPLENRALEYFDFLSWLESKIENRSFADIVKGKANPEIE